jgi:hypothetical protein
MFIAILYTLFYRASILSFVAIVKIDTPVIFNYGYNYGEEIGNFPKSTVTKGMVNYSARRDTSV